MASPARDWMRSQPPAHKFSPAQIDAMLDMVGTYSPREIQALFGISKTQFYHLLHDREKNNAIDSQA